MHTKQSNTVWILVTLVVLISVATVQATSAQTKLYDLYHASVSVDFSPDGRYIATGDTDGYVRLWEVSSGENIYYTNLGGQVQGVAFSPDGQYIAADGAGGGVRVILLEASSGTEVKSSYISDSAKKLNSVAYSPDGKYVAIGVDLRWAYLWEVDSGTRKGWGRRGASEVYAVAFSPDGKYLATGNDDGDADLWEVSSWWGQDADVQRFEPGGNVKAVAFSPNGRYLAADGYDGENLYVTIYDVIDSGRWVQQIDTNIEANALAFSPDGQYLAVGGTDPEITIYRIGTELIALVTAITRETTIQASGEVHDLAWSPDGDLISDGRAVWRTHLPSWDDSPGIRLVPPNDLISEVAFGPNLTYFVLTAQFPTLTRVENDVSYGKCTITLDLPGVPPNSLSAALGKSAIEYLRQNFNFTAWLLPGSLDSLAEHLRMDDYLDFLDQPPYFMLPLQTIEERMLELEDEANRGRVVGLLELIPLTGLATGEIERVQKINEIFQSTMDPKIVLNQEIDRWENPGRPDDQRKYIVILPKQVTDIKIKVEQEYFLKSDPLTLQTAPPYEGAYALENNAFAAPRAQPIALADYPPFQLLPPEVQDYLLRQFSALMNVETWRIPEETSLLPNYPNPFNPETWIPYHLAQAADVRLTIYDAKGAVVRQFELGHQAAGFYTARSHAAYWDGTNERGESVASGVYVYQLRTGDYTALRRMVILK